MRAASKASCTDTVYLMWKFQAGASVHSACIACGESYPPLATTLLFHPWMPLNTSRTSGRYHHKRLSLQVLTFVYWVASIQMRQVVFFAHACNAITVIGLDEKTEVVLWCNATVSADIILKALAKNTTRKKQCPTPTCPRAIQRLHPTSASHREQ